MKIYVALPARPGNSITAQILESTHQSGMNESVYCYKTSHLSLLTTNFNTLWCDALNKRKDGVTHFCMMHDDIAPEVGWLKKLYAEKVSVGADIVSTVIPLKDDRGLTSTGVMNQQRKMKKLSLHEALKLPTTFDAEGAGYRDHCLLMNTGLWLCDITKEWASMVCFRQHDTIVLNKDGEFKPQSVSEDWLWSVDMWRLGLRCFATTAVKVKHVGPFEYPNFVAWGSREDENEWAEAWNINPPATWGINGSRTGSPCDDDRGIVRQSRTATQNAYAVAR